MKKIFISAILLVCCSLFVSAQAVQEEVVEFDKVQATAFTLMLPDLNIDDISKAMQQHFETKAGLKSSKTKGYVAYLAQAYPIYGTQNFDIYTKVEEVGKKGAKAPKIYILVSKGNNNFVNSANDMDVVSNIKRDLASLGIFVREYVVNQKIIVKNNELQKLTKVKDDLSKDLNKLEKTLSETKLKISENDKQIKAVEAEIEKANNDLKSIR